MPAAITTPTGRERSNIGVVSQFRRSARHDKSTIPALPSTPHVCRSLYDMDGRRAESAMHITTPRSSTHSGNTLCPRQRPLHRIAPAAELASARHRVHRRLEAPLQPPAVGKAVHAGPDAGLVAGEPGGAEGGGFEHHGSVD